MGPSTAMGMRIDSLGWELIFEGCVVQLMMDGHGGPQEFVCRHPLTWGWILYSGGTHSSAHTHIHTYKHTHKHTPTPTHIHTIISITMGTRLVEPASQEQDNGFRNPLLLAGTDCLVSVLHPLEPDQISVWSFYKRVSTTLMNIYVHIYI